MFIGKNYHSRCTTMLYVNKRLNFIDLFKLFVIIQPVLDILTYFSLTSFQMTITVGIITRVLFMGISILYIFFWNRNPLKKYIVIYLILLFTVLGAGLILNFFNKPVFYLFSELQFYLKVLYFPILFCTILLLFSSNVENNKTKQMLLSSVSFAMLLTAISMFISIVTGTANSTYDFVKSGYTGWFFAGNEISAIVAITFPLVLINSIKKTKQIGDFIFWIPTLLIASCALLIGTKVSYFAVLLTILISLIFSIIVFLYSRIKKLKSIKSIFYILIFNILLSIFYFGITPLSPSYNNIAGDYVTINETVKENNQNTADKSQKSTHTNKKSNQKAETDFETKRDSILNSKILNILLSSRDIYFDSIYNDFKNASFIHKLVGLGYAGFYEGEPKLIEMDFFDIFFSFGILGFTLILLPLLVVFWKVIKTLFTHFFTFFRIENILLLFSLGLGLGVAFLAGHVLFAPAVSIYLTITMALLFHFHTTINSGSSFE